LLLDYRHVPLAIPSYTTARAGGRVAGTTNNLRVMQIAEPAWTAPCRNASRSDRIDPAREFCSHAFSRNFRLILLFFPERTACHIVAAMKKL
jgi:hypothetical protein